jgi:hypothetical protein
MRVRVWRAGGEEERWRRETERWRRGREVRVSI